MRPCAASHRRSPPRRPGRNPIASRASRLVFPRRPDSRLPTRSTCCSCANVVPIPTAPLPARCARSSRAASASGAPQDRGADGPSGFCVLGMGKLGGTELNFSSDVDLLYVYDRDGRTQGPQPTDHFAFYARLAEEVTRAIGAAPFVFRVDLDLRPEGRSGPIVNSLRALELYYEAQGAAWERFALLKALPVAGDLSVGEDALRRLAPFVWRKYLDLGAVEEMRVLKMRAEREAGRRGGPGLKP